MNTLLVDQLPYVLADPAPRHELACETSLRVAASMLANAASHEVTATRVIGTLGRDDQAAFESLLAEIDDEYGLESHFEVRGASFAVRFSRG